MRMLSLSSTLVITSILCLTACSNPTPGPDKTIGGGVLGAAWGAGAGAVIGNQLEGTPTGEGAGVGAGFGLISGAMAGLAYDSLEDTQIDQEQELSALKIRNSANAQQLAQIQRRLDQALASDLNAGVYQIFFDVDASSLRSGSIANLEAIADSLKSRTRGYYVNVVGHSDDAGTPEYNSRLAEARARSVASYLTARGLSSDQVKVSSFGSQRPIASNSTETGRQLNRRADVYISNVPQAGNQATVGLSAPLTMP